MFFMYDPYYTSAKAMNSRIKHSLKNHDMTSIFNTVIIILGMLTVTACRKTVEPPQPEPEKGNLYLHLHPYIDVAEVDDYNIVYTTTTEGRKISLTLAQYYVSNIQLVKSDGSLYPIPDTVKLKLQEVDTYFIAKVPSGNYKSIRFAVGLDPASNLRDPSASAILNRSEMWLGSSAQPDGYVFFNVQGTVDTSAAANGTIAQMQPFSYRIGTNANYKLVSMPDANYSVLPNQTQYVHLLVDYSKLFNGVQLNNAANLTVDSAADNATGLAATIRDNIPTMFSYEL
jgi:hypothetical protein